MIYSYSTIYSIVTASPSLIFDSGLITCIFALIFIWLLYKIWHHIKKHQPLKHLFIATLAFSLCLGVSLCNYNENQINYYNAKTDLISKQQHDHRILVSIHKIHKIDYF